MKPSTMAPPSDRNRAREVMYREALAIPKGLIEGMYREALTIPKGLINSYRNNLSIKPLGMVSAAL
jgi:hypothetical protein